LILLYRIDDVEVLSFYVTSMYREMYVKRIHRYVCKNVNVTNAIEELT
jgi:hypothetical protein